jgi:hypothetical protein
LPVFIKFVKEEIPLGRASRPKWVNKIMFNYQGFILNKNSFCWAHVGFTLCRHDGTGHYWCQIATTDPQLCLEQAKLESMGRLLIPPVQWASNSGAHFVRTIMKEPILAEWIHSAPLEIGRQLYADRLRLLVEYKADIPFGHIRGIWGKIIPMETLEQIPDRYQECPRHYAARLEREAHFNQGHLFLRKCLDGPPRIYSGSQPRTQEVQEFYNHSFSQIALIRRYSWGILGNVGAYGSENQIILSSKDHPELVLEGGWWEFFHPRPSIGMD